LARKAKEESMEAQIVEGNIGAVGKYDVEFKEGKLVVEVDANVAIGQAGLVVKIDAAKVIDAISAAIPGKIDDAVLGLIKAALVA
jgi:hypothetical protein